MSLAYYTDNDPLVCAWLEELIGIGQLAPGVVECRDIAEVDPNVCASFTQCHFFCGIGGWPVALRLAGWPDDRPVWTGSCPCQPFSGAGRQAGFNDTRHLWPAWYRLIEICQPPVIFGEQVSNALEWLDIVSLDLESDDYAFAAVDLPAAGVNAPHIRQRLWFVAVANSVFPEFAAGQRPGPGGAESLGARGELAGPGAADELALPARFRRRGRGDGDSPGDDGALQAAGRGAPGELDDSDCVGRRHGVCDAGTVDATEGGPVTRRGAAGELGDPADLRCGGGRQRDDRDAEGQRGDAPVGDAHRDGPAAPGAAGGVADDRARGRQRGENTIGPAGDDAPQRTEGVPDPERRRDTGGVADHDGEGWQLEPPPWIHGPWAPRDHAQRCRRTRWLPLGDPDEPGPQGRSLLPERAGEQSAGPSGVADELAQPGCADGTGRGVLGPERSVPASAAGECADPGIGSPAGVWDDCDWLFCRDGKWRPVEPGTFPLAHGVSGRVGRLRGYGNAIVPQVAAAFIKATQEVIDGVHD